ncbi:universal stress protein UspB [Photobacterium swingsii]|uniref:Universal stress protein B n=1 Tax=Photobacterium sanguinicancri TaxID=875932 RepID=A0AAW7Y4C6_9GAMM|nr:MULTISPECIES: universal stress protein UspB [Photobacterium]KMV28960.1 universal stress protein UspB [Photobacterium swingsii]MDO6499481.1 universal stress protein UspB [Photobacterium sanguinicancri]MDO6543222.1 universal stress protein UspB [Photobacterium sanguinicancri]
MISGDALLLALFMVAVVNVSRYVSTLRTLLAIMRECDPLLYQQVDGRGFFSSQGNVSKQIRLFHYIRSQQYHKHHDPVFMAKCIKVRRLFILASTFLMVFFIAIFVVAYLGM